MKQRTKRLLSWVLTLVMVVGLMPGMSLTAYAETALPANGSDAGGELKYYVGFENASRSSEPSVHWNLPTGYLVDASNNKICWAFKDTTELSKLYINFNANSPFIPKKYYLRTADGGEHLPGRNPKSWTIEARLNDSDEWDTIASVTDDSSISHASYTTTEFSFTNDDNKPYKYFRLNVTDVHSYSDTGSGHNGANVLLELSELYMSGIPTYEVTYKVINGTWSDDTTADKTEAVANGSKPASVPTGMKASQGYTGGAWDTDPADATITGATTFTYTFTAKYPQTITASDVTATYGDTDKSVSATTDGNGEISYAVKAGSENYIDVNASTGALTIKKVPADGKAYITVTAAETATYAQATKDVTVNISKATAVPATVTANNRTYDGTEKALVTVTGTPTGGTMYYALGTATEATEQYTTSIPAKTDAGTYYVWYKVVGDESHTDTDPQCVTVTISEGKTDDKSSSDKETAPEVEISGTVTDSNGAAIDATVELKMRNTSKDPIKRTSGGKFSFKEKLEDGTYNIVVTANISEQDRTVTKMVTVSDNGKTISNADVKFPAGNVNSEVKINETPGSAKTVVSDIAVDGITEEAEAYTNEAAGGKKVTVTLQAEAKTNLTDTDDSNLDSTQKQIKTEQTAIKQAAKTNDGNQKTLDYLDLSMFKTVTDGTSSGQGKKENIHETKSLITIVFKYDFSGKDKLSLYRYHDGNGLSGVQEIGDSDDSTAERIKIDPEAGTITAYLKYFSTYAIGYTTVDNSSQSTSSSGSSTGSTVTQTVKMDDIAEKYGITKDEMALTKDVITGLTTDEDPKGSTYYKLLARVTKRAKNSLTLKWDYLPYSDGYMVFGARCNTKNKEYKFELLETIDENDITSTRSFVHKDLKAKTYYKYMVVAYKKVGNQKMTVAASKVVHAPTKTAATTVAKKLKTSVSSVKLKVGDTKKLTTKEVKEDKGKKLKRHRKLMYESENPAIATVTKKGGKIKAISKGSVDIYVYAANGTYKKIRVTVK